MRRMKTLPLPCFVDAASVSVGDVIRVSWKVGDVEHTRTGTVGNIERRYGWIFITPDGNEIAHVQRTSNIKVRVTLLAEAPIKSEPLFEMEGING